MNNIWAVISSPCHNFSSPPPLFVLPLSRSWYYFLCADIIWPHDKLVEKGLKSWRLSLKNQALLAEGIAGKVSYFGFASFTQKHFCYWKKRKKEKHFRERQPAENEFLTSDRKNVKNVFMKFCVCLSCFRCCPGFYSVWHAVCISMVICYPVEVECLLCFVYLPPWCPHQLCSGR